MKQITTLTIPKTKGKELIRKSKLFDYTDSDFANWNLNDIGKPKPKTELSVLELTETMTFKQMFTHPEKMTLTQEQILEFVKNYKFDDKTYFFLFKNRDKFFVARVLLLLDGELKVVVNRFERDHIWIAGSRFRVVVPQTTETLLLTPTLDNAIKIVKEAGYKVYKEV